MARFGGAAATEGNYIWVRRGGDGGWVHGAAMTKGDCIWVRRGVDGGLVRRGSSDGGRLYLVSTGAATVAGPGRAVTTVVGFEGE